MKQKPLKYIYYPIWKLIFVRSRGAIVVFANAPAIAPAHKLVRTISVFVKCL